MAPKILVVDDNQELLGLLTQLFEEAGYSVVAASRGRQALEVARGADIRLAVLDVLLPDMMGYQLAEQLRKDQPDLPLVFITGVFRGGRHALEARNRHRALEYFEKPFDSAKLLATVAKAVPPDRSAGAAASAASDEFEVELDIDVDEGPLDAMELTGRIKVSGGDNLTAEMRGANLLAGPLPQPNAPLIRSIPTRPTPPPAPPRDGPGRSKRGELRDNLPSLIAAFYVARETGELGVQRGKVKKVVYFEDGMPVFAMSNLLSDRFGQFLVRVGKVTPEQVQDLAGESGRRTGDLLVERGILKETERLYYVGQQVKSILYSLFAWEEGTYVLSFRARARSETIKLDLHPANLVMRGIKKLYKPERLRLLISPEDRLIPSVGGVFQLHEVELERWEAELLPKVDGTRTMAELQALSGRPEHMLRGFLMGLLSLDILERRST